MKSLIVVLRLLLINGYCAYILNSGPETKPSAGKVWPKPKYERGCHITHFIHPNNFKFLVIGYTCDILKEALIRYKKIIQLSVDSLIYDIPKKIDKSKLITEISINLTSACDDYPQLNMDEWYTLEGAGRIYANSIWGILRGLETYSQLVTPTGTGIVNNFIDVRINDSPRFPHRGLMIDTARHYIKVSTILTILDGMAYNKLNVLHWHIVDDESFPYQSTKFPELSKKGAYMASMIYTKENISKIIEYARMRGIRIVPEFDIPGHTASWGNSHPEILTTCGNKPKKFGSINPISETGFMFLVVLFEEVLEIFKDNFLHIGGNDVNVECWDTNENIFEYSKLHQMRYFDMYHSFMKRITDLLSEKGFLAMVWEEAVLQNNYLPRNILVQVLLNNWKYSLNSFTNVNYRVILSECWNFDQITNIWDSYLCDPHDFDGNFQQKNLVIGGEACMWSNLIGDRNIVQNIFPRISVTAERLWSEKSITNTTDAHKRLEEHICRMIARGIPAEPLLGPGFCG